MWTRAPEVTDTRTHWQRIADARPHSRWACIAAQGLLIGMIRSVGVSVSGWAAASRARSMPYRAISSAALAVRASASSG
jgi:hypothetical protein